MRKLSVHLLPSLVPPEALAGRTVAVIDVLRATTTIVTALAAGAREVRPCLEVEEARRLAQTTPGALLGGEREGVLIEGFDLGNSPEEYTSDRVAGRTIVFTTTNGTRAMMRCRLAERVLIAAFVNFSAVCSELAASERVDLVCAGTRGQITREDVLLAGAIADDALRADESIKCNDQAWIAVDAWRAAVNDFRTPGALLSKLQQSQGGRNVLEIGQQHDVDLAAEVDRYDIAPQLDLRAWRITRR